MPPNLAVGSKLLTDVNAWLSHPRHSNLMGMECDPGIGSFQCSWVMPGKIWELLIITNKRYTIARSNTNTLQ